MKRIDNLLKNRGFLARKLSRFRDMIPGSFSERKLTCGKPNCICVTEGKKHIAYQLTYRSKNKTVTKMIPKHRADDVKKRVQMQKQFSQIVKQIQEINIELLLYELNKKK